MTRRRLWTLAGALALAGLPVAASASDRHAYGPRSHQSLQIVRGAGGGPHALVLMTGGSAMMAQARRLAARGMTVAIVQRRAPAYGFHPGTSDLVSALAWVLARKDTYELDGRIAFWGEAEGAAAALLIGRDRRYLQRIGMVPRDISGMVLVDQVALNDATFTVPSAYGLADPPALYRTDKRKAADGAAFLSGLF